MNTESTGAQEGDFFAVVTSNSLNDVVGHIFVDRCEFTAEQGLHFAGQLRAKSIGELVLHLASEVAKVASPHHGEGSGRGVENKSVESWGSVGGVFRTKQAQAPGQAPARFELGIACATLT